MGGAERAEVSAVGRDEDERVGRLRLHERRAADRRECAGELDQSTCAGGVVVRASAFAGVVAVRGDHDRALRRAADDRDEVLELDLAAPGDLRSEPLHPGLEAIELELVGDPTGGAETAGRPGRPVRILAGELAGQLLGDCDLERWWKRRRRQRLRPRDAEGRQEQRQGDEKPRSPHEPCVHGSLDRAAAWARARRARSSGRRHCTGQCRDHRGRL